MRRLFLVFVLFMALPLGAQNLKGFYVQKIHPDGLLYFVYPQKMAEMQGNMKLCRGSLLYDYTYLDARDSVTLLITVETNAVFSTDSLFVDLPDGSRYACAVEMIYCEPRKNAWRCRARCMLTYDVWVRMYKEQPFTLTLFSIKDNVGLCFRDKAGTWSKVCARFRRLQEMIRLNRKS
ncbi:MULTISPECIES: hypothetical protein [Butyricimonas]|uniref:hypothetical protein n=1 Tax=Butyricimonas TaxID=574697 RepID=UPI001D05E86D|nr:MULTISPECIES: hypothetical protein [Butyricimonas]MCB6972422.1 hypothetical protein [Butyricimonas synergistica]MCG4519430.1 hypothetical protein [Butyricimonas sp. DFI.6.44]